MNSEYSPTILYFNETLGLCFLCAAASDNEEERIIKKLVFSSCILCYYNIALFSFSEILLVGCFYLLTSPLQKTFLSSQIKKSNKDRAEPSSCLDHYCCCSVCSCPPGTIYVMIL